MIYSFILFIILSFTGFAQSCDTITDQYNIFATINETKEWDIRQNFFKGENLNFSLVQNYTQLKINNPITEIGEPIKHNNGTNGQIKSIKPLKSSKTGAWLNDFIFLKQGETNTDVYYSLRNQQTTYSVPNFSNFVNIRNYSEQISCFDLEWLSQTKIIIDCSQIYLNFQTQNYEKWNGFIMFDLINSSFYNISLNNHPVESNYIQANFRKIIYQNITFIVGQNGEEIQDDQTNNFFDLTQLQYQTQINQYLFRLEPAWAFEYAEIKYDKLDNNCEIEVYQFNQSNIVSDLPILILNKESLGQAMGKKLDTLTIIDFQIKPNNTIYIVDAYNGIYIVKITVKNTLQYINTIPTSQKDKQIFGFDINYLLQLDGIFQEQFIIVFNNIAQFYENNILKFTIQLQQYPVQYSKLQVQISQKYIVLKLDQQLFQYDSNNGLLIYQQTSDKLEHILINYFNPDIVVIDNEQSHRFQLSNGILQLNPQQNVLNETITYILKATNILNQLDYCQITIKLDILLKNDTSIKLQNKSSIPHLLTIPSDPIEVNLIASGPNLHYKSFILGDAKLKSKIRSSWELNYSGINLPNADQIIYSDIMVINHQFQTIFYLLVQIHSNIVYIYKCIQNLNEYNYSECTDYITFSLSEQITTNKFSWHYVQQQIYIYQQNTPYSLQIYKIYENKIALIGTIYPTSKSDQSQITSFAYSNNEIYLIIEQTKEVQIYSASIPFELLYVINQDELTQFNVNEQFNPKKIFSNKNVSQLIFIQTNNEILIGQFLIYNKQPSFILFTQIKLSLQNCQVEVIIGKDHFFIIQITNNQQLIEEYNYKNIQQIYKTKDLPLYNYKIQTPLTITYSKQTGWLYVRATDNTQTLILVYKPGVLYQESLHKVIETKNLSLDIFNMAIDGNDLMVIYINNNIQHKILCLFSDAKLYFDQSFKSKQQYVNDIAIVIQVNNYRKNKPQHIYQRLTVLNTQTQLYINQSFLDQDQNKFKFLKQVKQQIIYLGNDWIINHPTNLIVSCQKCNKIDYQINSNIQAQIQLPYNVQQGSIFGNFGSVFQEEKSLLFLNKQGKLIKRLKLNVEGYLNMITVSDDAKYILSTYISYSRINSGLIITSCSNGLCEQFRQGSAQLNGLSQISKIKMIDSQNIIILNSDTSNFNLDSFIQIVTFEQTDTQFTLYNNFQINAQFVDNQDLKIGDFDYINNQLNGVDYTILIFTDINQGLYFIHLLKDQTGKLIKSTYELLQLRFYSHKQFYLKEDTIFYQIKIINSKISGNIIQLMILITTNNSAQYIFYVELDGSTPQIKIPIIQDSISLQYVLSPYGTWNSINKSCFDNGYLIIPYIQQTKIILGIYELSLEKTDNVKTIQFQHSIQEEYHTGENFLLLLQKNQENQFPNIYTNIHFDFKYAMNPLTMYQLFDGPQLILMNTINYEDNIQIIVQVNNHFNTVTGVIHLTTNNKNSSQALDFKNQIRK